MAVSQLSKKTIRRPPGGRRASRDGADEARLAPGEANLSPRARAAIARARRMLELKEQQHDPRGVAACYLRLGDAYLACGEGEKAEEAYRASLSLARSLR